MSKPFLPRWATKANVARPLVEPAVTGGDTDERACGTWEQFDEMVAELEAMEALQVRIAIAHHRAASACSRPLTMPRRTTPRRRGTRCRRSASSDDNDGDGAVERRALRRGARR